MVLPRNTWSYSKYFRYCTSHIITMMFCCLNRHIVSRLIVPQCTSDVMYATLCILVKLRSLRISRRLGCLGSIPYSTHSTFVCPEKSILTGFPLLAPPPPSTASCALCLPDVIENWDKLTVRQDGDAIRRLIGTIGISSPLSSLKRAFISVRDAEEESVRKRSKSHVLVLVGIFHYFRALSLEVRIDVPWSLCRFSVKIEGNANKLVSYQLT